MPEEVRQKISDSMKGHLPNSGCFKKGVKLNLGKKFPQMQGENHPMWSGRLEKKCGGCDKMMSLARWEQKRVYCSHTCDKQHRLRKRIERDTKPCQFCKETFTAPDPRAKFCSPKCRGAHLAIKFKGRQGYRPKDSYKRGAENENWKGGKASSLQELRSKVRMLNEYKTWHSTILRRDGWKCVLCSHDRNLEVDHIVSFKKIVTKYAITDTVMALACAELWDLDNGRTLCGPCHKKTPNYGRKKQTEN